MASLQFTAFCSPMVLLPRVNRRQRSAQPCITMRKTKRKSGPKGPSRLPKDSADRIEEIAGKYGIRSPRPGEQLDRKFNQPSSSTSNDQTPPTLYQRLAAAFGIEALDAAEKVLGLTLATLLAVFLASGLAISAEAFFKASGKHVPDSIDALLVNLEHAFTPTLLVFLALSSVFGLYKQSQLSSGATSYSALSKDDNDN